VGSRRIEKGRFGIPDKLWNIVAKETKLVEKSFLGTGDL